MRGGVEDGRGRFASIYRQRGDRAFAEVLGRFENSRRDCVRATSFFVARAAAAEAQHRAAQDQAGSVAISEERTTRDTWLRLKQNTEARSAIHAQYAGSLRGDVVAPLTAMGESLKRTVGQVVARQSSEAARLETQRSCTKAAAGKLKKVQTQLLDTRRQMATLLQSVKIGEGSSGPSSPGGGGGVAPRASLMPGAALGDGGGGAEGAGAGEGDGGGGGGAGGSPSGERRAAQSVTSGWSGVPEAKHRRPPRPRPLRRHRYRAEARAIRRLVWALMAAVASAADPWPASTSWTDARTLGIHGRGWPEAELPQPYARLPATAEAAVTPITWELSLTATGMSTAFATAATDIYVRYNLTSRSNGDWLWPLNGHSGVDVYVRAADTGGWRWATSSGNGCVKMSEVAAGELYGACLLGLAPLPAGQEREVMVYFPSRGVLGSIEIGVAPEAALRKVPAFGNAKPILWYGTSIVHGAASTRPGMVWTNIANRMLDTEGLNLGFSGDCLM